MPSTLHFGKVDEEKIGSETKDKKMNWDSILPTYISNESAAARKTKLPLSSIRLICFIFSFQGLNAALFYENPDPRSYVSLVPTSAVTGEGMGNLLAMIVQACEGPLHKRLIFSQQLLATVLEVCLFKGLFSYF